MTAVAIAELQPGLRCRLHEDPHCQGRQRSLCSSCCKLPVNPAIGSVVRSHERDFDSRVHDVSCPRNAPVRSFRRRSLVLSQDGGLPARHGNDGLVALPGMVVDQPVPDGSQNGAWPCGDVCVRVGRDIPRSVEECILAVLPLINAAPDIGGARNSGAVPTRQRVNGRGAPTAAALQITVVFGRNLLILLSQLQPLLILSLVTRPVYTGGPSPFQGSWR